LIRPKPQATNPGHQASSRNEPTALHSEEADSRNVSKTLIRKERFYKMGQHFNPLHVQSVASFKDFLVSRKAMLAATPIAANPTLFVRTQEHQDLMLETIRTYKGDIHDQQDSVDFDNEVEDERDRRRNYHRRDLRKSVIRGKREHLDVMASQKAWA
jgi:hypothetical protein